MTLKPWEETWEYERAGSMRMPDGDAHFGPLAGDVSEDNVARARLASAAPEMARVLLDTEWSGWDGENGMACPSCGAPAWVPPIRHDADGKYVGHTEGTHRPDCPLDSALRKAGIR